MSLMIDVKGLSKTFTLHNQGSVALEVLDNIYLQAKAGECTVLFGESGSGKSTLLRTLYGNYLPSKGAVLIKHHDEWVDLATAGPQNILRLRRDTLGYVSQFLRVIPRIGALNVVMQPLLERQVDPQLAQDKAQQMLTRLHIPERLWSLPPSTFSGGEQQRINIARGFIVDYPVLLLDEPTASLDAGNSAVVVELIEEALSRGTAIVGIFHDADVREKVASRIFHVGQDSDWSDGLSASSPDIANPNLTSPATSASMPSSESVL